MDPLVDLVLATRSTHKMQEIRKLLEGVPDGAFFYFVHSFYVDAEREVDVIATTDYEIDYCSIAGKDRFFGVQFHPEKSQDAGLCVLRNFARIAEA